MMKRRVAALILAFAFMAGAALGEPESEFEYYIGEDGTACISGYAGSAVDLALPAELGGVAVTAVEEYAFYGLNDVQTAVVPEGYAVLGDCAFGWCSQLRRVTLPSSLRQVGKNPLIGCDVIQDVVTAGEAFAFEDGLLLNRDEGLVVACVALTAGEDVVIPDGVTEIGGGAFYNINTVKSVTLPPTLEAIGEDAFAYCYGLSRMEIPEGVGQIADTAFDGLDELVLIVAPDSYAQTWCQDHGVTWMATVKKAPTSEPETASETEAPSETSAPAETETPSETSVPAETQTPDETPAPDETEAPTATPEPGDREPESEAGTDTHEVDSSAEEASTAPASALYVPGETFDEGDFTFVIRADGSASAAVYHGADNNVTVPGEVADTWVTALEEDLFRGMDQLTGVTLPDSVVDIGSRAFYGCLSLESVSLPPHTRSLGDFAFYNCRKLETVSLPASLTAVGRNPFISCVGLGEFTVDPENPVLETVDGALCDRETGTLICCPYTAVEGYYEVPAQIREIGAYAFYNCRGLTDLAVHGGVERIGSYAFLDCVNLKTADIREGVAVIGIKAFGYCAALEAVSLPASLERADSWAFISSPNVTVVAPENSYAADFCRANGIALQPAEPVV